MSQNLLISAVMTVVSIARGYAVRRYAQKNLNKLTRKISYYFIKDKV
jgi:hypothetical protein